MDKYVYLKVDTRIIPIVDLSKLTYSKVLKSIPFPGANLNTVGSEELCNSLTIFVPEGFEVTVSADPSVGFVAYTVV